MLDVAVLPLVGKLVTINRFAPRAVTACEIATLAHEAGDDAVERRVLEVKRRARASSALFAGAEAAKVLGRLRNDVGAQSHLDAARGSAANSHIEENNGVGHGVAFE